MGTKRTIRIGGGQGFYGDTPSSVAGLLEAGIDYLCLEALAELTLAILQKDRQRDESRGYTRDLPRYLGAALPAIAEGRTKLITNAGGINPTAAARAAIEVARSMGISGINIATVLGDDLMPRVDEIGSSLVNLDTGEPFSELPSPPRFVAAYLGARPIVEALERGADVVITGRVADAALFLAPLIFEHGWSFDDWDRLAAGVLVGHLLECSGQVAGGNFSGEWWTVPHPWDLPYPIAEVAADGTAVITKPTASGGRVDVDTVRHQLLYEVHDPAAYLSPDVQGTGRAPRRLGRRGEGGVLVARRVREGRGRGRDLRAARRAGRPRGARVVLRAVGCRRPRWSDGSRHRRGTARGRDARRLAVRRRAHRRARRPRDDAAHVVGTARRPHRHGPGRAGRRKAVVDPQVTVTVEEV